VQGPREDGGHVTGLRLALAGLTLDRLLPVLVNAYRMAGGASVGEVRSVVNAVALLCLLAGLLLVLALFARRPAENPPTCAALAPPAAALADPEHRAELRSSR
jgi:hypothetical protein